MTSSEVPPDWLIIETVVRLQKLARHEHNPTQVMICQTMRETQGIPYDYDVVDDRMRALEAQEVLLRTSGSYTSSVRWRLHPSYVPEDPIPDPYTPKERKLLQRLVEEQARLLEDARRIHLEARREKDRERAARRRIQRARDKARESLDLQPVLELYDAGTMDSVEVMAMIEDDPGGVFVIDTETTGLDACEDDVLELSIINGAGRTVYTGRFDSWRDDWPEAERIHGIAPEDVRGLPKLEDESRAITGLLRRARVIVGYNVDFDVRFLVHAGVRFPKVPQCDVMERFARVYGEWADWIDDGRGGWKWQTLAAAGSHYGLDVRGAHASLVDCRITLEVLKRIAREPESVRLRRIPRGFRREGGPDTRKGRGRRAWETVSGRALAEVSSLHVR